MLLLSRAGPILPVHSTNQNRATVITAIRVIAQVPAIRVVRLVGRSGYVRLVRPSAFITKPTRSEEEFAYRVSARPVIASVGYKIPINDHHRLLITQTVMQATEQNSDQRLP